MLAKDTARFNVYDDSSSRAFTGASCTGALLARPCWAIRTNLRRENELKVLCNLRTLSQRFKKFKIVTRTRLEKSDFKEEIDGLDSVINGLHRTGI